MGPNSKAIHRNNWLQSCGLKVQVDMAHRNFMKFLPIQHEILELWRWIQSYNPFPSMVLVSYGSGKTIMQRKIPINIPRMLRDTVVLHDPFLPLLSWGFFGWVSSEVLPPRACGDVFGGPFFPRFVARSVCMINLSSYILCFWKAALGDFDLRYTGMIWSCKISMICMHCMHANNMHHIRYWYLHAYTCQNCPKALKLAKSTSCTN